MGYLVSIMEFCEITGLKRYQVARKIENNVFPEGAIVSLPTVSKTRYLKIDIELIADHNPGFRDLLKEKKVILFKKNNLLTIQQVAEALNCHAATIYHRVIQGLYPYVDIGKKRKDGKKTLIMISKDETLKKYPQLMPYLEHL